MELTHSHKGPWTTGATTGASSVRQTASSCHGERACEAHSQPPGLAEVSVNTTPQPAVPPPLTHHQCCPDPGTRGAQAAQTSAPQRGNLLPPSELIPCGAPLWVHVFQAPETLALGTSLRSTPRSRGGGGFPRTHAVGPVCLPLLPGQPHLKSSSRLRGLISMAGDGLDLRHVG